MPATEIPVTLPGLIGLGLTIILSIIGLWRSAITIRGKEKEDKAAIDKLEAERETERERAQLEHSKLAAEYQQQTQSLVGQLIEQMANDKAEMNRNWEARFADAADVRKQERETHERERARLERQIEKLEQQIEPLEQKIRELQQSYDTLFEARKGDLIALRTLTIERDELKSQRDVLNRKLEEATKRRSANPPGLRNVKRCTKSRKPTARMSRN